MRIEVIGKEIRSFKDTDASADAGHEVRKEFIILHCVHDPSRKDKTNVNGRQVLNIRVYSGNGLFDDCKSLDVPCVLNAELNRTAKGTYLDDFDLIE